MGRVNSCLYETRIMHHRLIPCEHRFEYKFFSFYVDLDELDAIVAHSRWVSRNRFNVYAFHDRDHVTRGGLTLKESVEAYLADRRVDIQGGRVMLLTFFRTWGYVFNPVSFYFCFDRNQRPVGVIPEVGNTFGELKLFYIDGHHGQGDEFHQSVDKFYYVSPFTRLNDQFDFCLSIPGEKLNIQVDTSRQGRKVILTEMTGQRQEWTDQNLLRLTWRFPWVTLKVITLIHWHALRLWLKRVPFEFKTANPHHQKEVYRAWRQKSHKTPDD